MRGQRRGFLPIEWIALAQRRSQESKDFFSCFPLLPIMKRSASKSSGTLLLGPISIAILLLLSTSGCQHGPPKTRPPDPASEVSAELIPDPDRPPPVLPPEALFVGAYGNLELTISVDRAGSVRSVSISKPSKAKLYDQHSRVWVEKKWK